MPPSQDTSLPTACMGATPHAEGVTFRLWAPNAQQVSLIGSFNDWSCTAHPMQPEDNGHWAVDVPGLKAGAEYKFHLTLADGSTVDRMDPQARQVTNSVGTSVVYDTAAFDWQGDEFTLATHDALVIYELHIGSFNAEESGTPGDFASATAQLDHLHRLGVNAVQVMPVAEFAGDFSWGYNPAHLFAVESAYGGPDAFKTFVREAHSRGIGVILDVVYNHFGPSDLDIWQFDGWQENDKGGIYFYNDERSTTPWGDTRPDYGRSEVRQFIRDNALMWLNEYRVDGLRFDMTLYMRTIRGEGNDDLPDAWSLMQWITDDIRASHPHAITIAEDLREHHGMTAHVGEGGAGFHAQWDACFVHPVRQSVITPEDADRSMAAVRDAIAYRYNDDAFRRVVYSESHDEVANGKARVPQEVNPDDAEGWYAQKRSTLAAALVFTSPGIPMLFQGQEFLQGEWFRDDVPLDWDQSESFSGIVRLYHDLVRVRTNRNGFTRGLTGQGCNVFHVNEAMNIIAFHRWREHGAGDDVIVVLNFSAETRDDYLLGLPEAGTWWVRVNTDSRFYSPDFQQHGSASVDALPESRDGLAAQAPLSIGPYTALILSQHPQ